MNVTVNAVNDPPVAGTFTETGFEDAVLVVDGWNFTDVEGDAAAYVGVTALPGNGTLFLDRNENDRVDGGEAVRLFDPGDNTTWIEWTDASGGNVKFAPKADWFGSTTLSYRVRDSSAGEWSVADADGTLKLADVPEPVTDMGPAVPSHREPAGFRRTSGMALPLFTSFDVPVPQVPGGSGPEVIPGAPLGEGLGQETTGSGPTGSLPGAGPHHHAGPSAGVGLHGGYLELINPTIWWNRDEVRPFWTETDSLDSLLASEDAGDDTDVAAAEPTGEQARHRAIAVIIDPAKLSFADLLVPGAVERIMEGPSRPVSKGGIEVVDPDEITAFDCIKG